MGIDTKDEVVEELAGYFTDLIFKLTKKPKGSNIQLEQVKQVNRNN